DIISLYHFLMLSTTFILGTRAHPALHSFPTRRSSDLPRPALFPAHHLVPRGSPGSTRSDGRTPCRRPAVQARPQRASLNGRPPRDRKSTRLNSSHVASSYAVFCLKKKKSTKDTISSLD